MIQRIGYRVAVARQPESLAEGLLSASRALAALPLDRFAGKAVGFAGIGASYQAALIGAALLRQHGRRAFAYCPTDLYDGSDAAADAFVALSASGQSREIVDVMRLRTHCPQIAVCRAADNPLARLTGAVVPTGSGPDNGASSTGYTGMLLAIGLLGEALLALPPMTTSWTALPDLVARVLDEAAPMAAQAAERLAKCSGIDIVGGGADFATAGEAAMLIREAVRVPAAPWDTLNYLHGPMESQDSRTGLIVFGEGRNEQIARDMSAICPSVLITPSTDISPAAGLTVIPVPRSDNLVIDAILKIVAAQLVVGVMQDAAGLTDITFRYRQTDTKLKPWSASEV